jgi:hypothetical protein
MGRWSPVTCTTSPLRKAATNEGGSERPPASAAASEASSAAARWLNASRQVRPLRPRTIRAVHSGPNPKALKSSTFADAISGRISASPSQLLACIPAAKPFTFKPSTAMRPNRFTIRRDTLCAWSRRQLAIACDAWRRERRACGAVSSPSVGGWPKGVDTLLKPSLIERAFARRLPAAAPAHLLWSANLLSGGAVICSVGPNGHPLKQRPPCHGSIPSARPACAQSCWDDAPGGYTTTDNDQGLRRPTRIGSLPRCLHNLGG